jgi:hypothetical protein
MVTLFPPEERRTRLETLDLQVVSTPRLFVFTPDDFLLDIHLKITDLINSYHL